MMRRSAVRASDSDREQVVERLRQAAGEGRLLNEELEERLGVAFSARTYGQLHQVISDLPRLAGDGPLAPVWVRASLGVAGAVGVLAAAFAAMLLFLTIAGAAVAWTVLSRAIASSRERQLRRGSTAGLPPGN